MTQIDIGVLYSQNKEFKEFVDKYARNIKTTAEIVFTHATVKDVAEYYMKKNSDLKETFSI